MAWLITGGAGYIGAHVVAAMRAAGESVVVLDDLSTGDASRIPDVDLVVGSVLNGKLVEQVVNDFPIDGVVHVAAKKQVEESVREPLLYYRENVEGLRVLLEKSAQSCASSFVFSSSAAVYGAPDIDLVYEGTACSPVNPYGSTKLVGENMVREVAAATGMRYINLRYFNVAGAASPALADRSASNLVPMVFQRLTDRQPPVIFGADYDTPDGSCIRDFVHVADIASAHVVAAKALAEARLTQLTANIGRGQGVSVREMIETIRVVSGTATADWAEPVIHPRRSGDPPRVVAAVDRAITELGWQSRYSVEDMVSSAWAGWPGRTTAQA